MTIAEALTKVRESLETLDITSSEHNIRVIVTDMGILDDCIRLLNASEVKDDGRQTNQ